MVLEVTEKGEDKPNDDDDDHDHDHGLSCDVGSYSARQGMSCSKEYKLVL
jgi:hypothetical protein